MSKAGKVSKTYTITSRDGAAVSISQRAARLSTFVTNFVNSFDNYDGYPAIKVDLTKEQLLRCINWCEMHRNDTTDALSNTHAEVFVDFTMDDLDDMISSSELLGIKLLTNRLVFSAQQITNRSLIPQKFRDKLDMNEATQCRTEVEESSVPPVNVRESETVGYNAIQLLIALGFSFQDETSRLKALVIGKSEDDRRIFMRLFDEIQENKSLSVTIQEKTLPRKRSIRKLWANRSSLSFTEILVKDDNQTTILCVDFVIREQRHEKFKRGYKSFDAKSDFLRGYHVIEEMCKFCCNGIVAKYQIPKDLAFVSLRENHIDRFEIGSVHSFYIASVLENNKRYVAVDQSKALTALNIAQAISKLSGKSMVTSTEINIAKYFYEQTLKYTYKYNHQYEERK